MEKYLTLACGYLGIVAAQVINPRIEGDEFVLVYNLGGQGCPKTRIPLELLDALDVPEDAGPEADNIEEMTAQENQDWDGESQPGLIEAEVDATDGALRLMEQKRIDPADVLFLIGGDKRITARDVRRYMKEELDG